MTLPKEKIDRIRQLYKICYGLASEAERVLAEEDPTSTISSGVIAKYWKAEKLEPNKKGEVLENLVREAHRCSGEDLEKMNEYLKRLSRYFEGDREIERLYLGEKVAYVYARRLGLQIKVNTDLARNKTGNYIGSKQKKSGKKINSRGRYALCEMP